MANFICDETQELLTIYDYKPFNVEMKYKGKKNGLPVTNFCLVIISTPHDWTG